MGLMSNLLTQSSAHIGSLALSLSSVVSRLMDIGFITDVQQLLDCPIVKEGESLWAEIHHILGKQPDCHFQAFLANSESKLQHAFSEKLHKNLLNCIVEEADVRAISRIQSAGGIGASAFLVACPSHEYSRLSNDQMEIAVKRRLGINLCSLLNTNVAKCVCGADLDELGDHLICCKKGNDRFLVHYGIIHNFAAIFRDCQLIVQTEKPLASLGPMNPLLSGKRADLLITFRNKTPYLADVSVVHSTPLNADSLVKYAKKPGAAASIREKEKNNKYKEASNQVAHNFVPLIIESYGRVGEECRFFMKDLAKESIRKQLLHTDDQLAAQLLHSWWIKISCSLQKTLANLILSRSFKAQESKNAITVNKISVNLLRNRMYT